MRVRVVYLGILKDHAGKPMESLELTNGARVSDLWRQLTEKYPKFSAFTNSAAVAVNQEYAPPNTELKDGFEIALLPPVSGGVAEGTERETPYVRIVHDRIVPHDIIPPLECPEDGAIVIFDGVVRNHSRGRPTRYLEYEAYEEMALKKIQELVVEALEKFPIRNVALVHRLGHLEIGESSVLIAVFSAHRAAAFDACRWLIDTLKKTVPIYKKEYFEDGAVWADGEPFPEDWVVGNL
ncbi:MAG: MoaD family protein [Terriglobia bacterium]|nr:MoaD family protein [Terriglobia bacterium]